MYPGCFFVHAILIWPKYFVPGVHFSNPCCIIFRFKIYFESIRKEFKILEMVLVISKIYINRFPNLQLEFQNIDWEDKSFVHEIMNWKLQRIRVGQPKVDINSVDMAFQYSRGSSSLQKVFSTTSTAIKTITHDGDPTRSQGHKTKSHNLSDEHDDAAPLFLSFFQFWL